MSVHPFILPAYVCIYHCSSPLTNNQKAANYLEIVPLLGQAVYCLAETTRYEWPQGIRSVLRLPNDISDDDKKKLRNEDEWLFVKAMGDWPEQW